MTAKRGTSQGPDEGAKKVRKPYTITKSRESWTEAEHQKFLEALQLFDRDWKKIEAFVGTKTVIQIRSHAQKYILKVQKNGTGEHVPPPRPKRKSAQPYPQKAQKSGSQSLSGPPALPGPSREEMLAFALPTVPPATFGVRQSPLNSDLPASPWIHHSLPPSSTTAFVPKDPSACVSHGSGPAAVAMGRVKGSLEAINSSPRGRSSQNSNSALWQKKQSPGPDSGSLEGQRTGKGAPDFSSVYRFIGSVFDPQITGHLKRLKELPTIDRETVVLLMRNLAINLESPEFEQHRLFLNVYDPTTNPAIPDVGFGLQAPTVMDFSYDDDSAYMEGGHGGMGMPSWPMAAIEDGLAGNDMQEIGLHSPFSNSTHPAANHLQAGMAPPPQQRWWRGDPRSMQASHKAAAKTRHLGGVQGCQSQMYGVP